MNNIIEELIKDNLSTYFILPLVELNKFSFGESNFINCFIDKNVENCYVKVLRLVPHIKSHTNIINRNNYIYYVFSIDKKWEKDTKLYIKGEYSKLSDEAKDIINNRSGLVYNVKTKESKDNVLNDIRLLALRKDPVVKDFWKKHIYGEDKKNIINDDMELLSKPSEIDFIENELSV